MSDELVRAKVWRLHFWTGLFLSPFFIVLALTGIVYLFKPQVEPIIYKKWLEVPVGATRHTYDEQLKVALSQFPNSSLKYFVPPSGEGKTTQFIVQDDHHKQQTVYVDPYTNQVTGVQRTDLTLMQLAHDIHGTLLLGDFGALIMEISAGWAFILLATGLYIWWPFRGIWRKAFWPSLRSRPSWKAFHGTLGLVASLLLFFFILTGIPWTRFTGLGLNIGAGILHLGSPPGFGPSPFLSEESNGRAMVSLDTLAKVVQERIPGATPKITYPYDHKHAAVILWTAPNVTESAFIHVDAYSGQVLHDYRWKDFGPIGKAISYGIALHQGMLFGLGNQLLNIVVALSALALALSGLWMWWLRRPANAWFAPPPQVKVPLPKVIVATILFFSLIVPTAGITFLIFLGLEWVRGKGSNNPAGQ